MNIHPHLRTALTALFMLTTTIVVQAQTPKENLVPHEGFWVVETLPKEKNCVVRFYNDEQKLIYAETVNQKLNIKRSRVKNQLNAALDQAMFVWNATHKVPSDRQWVAVQLEKK